MRVCMIGSRDPTLVADEKVILFRRMATHCGRQRHTVVTMPSFGACQLAAESALVVGGTVEVWEPGYGYGEMWLTPMIAEHGERVVHIPFDLADPVHQELIKADQELHPERRGVDRLDAAFFACVYGIVLSSDFLVALPTRDEIGVETAPAIRIARHLEKPLLVLTNITDRLALEVILEEKDV